jgi:RNA polymerase sigma factor, sigma-70 family
MCCDEDAPEVPLSFAEFVILLQRPPFEPCVSELEFLTRDEYQNAFDEIMRLYRRPIIYYIAHLTSDFSNAPDIAHDVFLNIYKARSSFHPSYIYRAARNAAYSDLRHRNVETRFLRSLWPGVRRRSEWEKSKSEINTPDTRPLQDEALMKRAREEATKQAVERLPEHFRVPLLLFVKGESYRQIAKSAQLKVGTVKSRICRGKALLRRRLRDYL